MKNTITRVMAVGMVTTIFATTAGLIAYGIIAAMAFMVAFLQTSSGVI